MVTDMNKQKIEQAVRLFLEGIGEDPEREGLRQTPERIGRMCEEIFAGYSMDAEEPLSRVFEVSDAHMVLEQDIHFYSVCEHHFLPFFGKVHIAYLPDKKVVGLSKLARTVEVFAKRAQIQEQMTTQIAEAVMEYLKPRGVMVMVEAEHMCMTMRGVKKPGTKTITYAALGAFEEKEMQDKFFQLLQLGKQK